jgi:hypothetical protein
MAGHMSHELSVLATLAGAMMFFLLFPTSNGTNPPVIGPATDLVSLQAWPVL